MYRAWLYLCASAVVWFIEGWFFAYFLHFTVAQSVLLAGFYIALFGVAARLLLRSLRTIDETSDEFSAWRLISLLPMLVVIIGSFVSLPVLLLVVLIGKLL